MFDVVEHDVTQHESITLKFDIPRLTRGFIKSFFNCTNPDNGTPEKSFSGALVQ
jgi:hypothetical protein